jgi:hypothetical protein
MGNVVRMLTTVRQLFEIFRWLLSRFAGADSVACLRYAIVLMVVSIEAPLTQIRYECTPGSIRGKCAHVRRHWFGCGMHEPVMSTFSIENLKQPRDSGPRSSSSDSALATNCRNTFRHLCLNRTPRASSSYRARRNRAAPASP